MGNKSYLLWQQPSSLHNQISVKEPEASYYFIDRDLHTKYFQKESKCIKVAHLGRGKCLWSSDCPHFQQMTQWKILVLVIIYFQITLTLINQFWSKRGKHHLSSENIIL